MPLTTAGETLIRPAATRGAHEEASPDLGGVDLHDLHARVARALDERGITFGGERFTIDPVPRAIPAQEWAELERGLTQRVRALSRFVEDVYGPRRIVEAGVVPARVIESADHYEPAMRSAPMPAGGPIVLAGLDVVRNQSGRFMVLEDTIGRAAGRERV